MTNKYCPGGKAAGRERGLATPHLSRMPAKEGRSSDKADCLVWQNQGDRANWKVLGMSVANGGGALKGKGRSLRSGLARPALPLTGGHLQGRQAGKAGRQP